MITIKLDNFLKDFSKNKEARLEIELVPGYTVQDVLNLVNIKRSWVGYIVINGKVINYSYKLCPGDLIELYPIFGGG